MSNYVKIAEGVVVQRQPYPEDGFVEAPEGVVCGWLWDGEEFAAPPLPPAPAPASCTRRQGRLALLAHGSLATVEASIAAITDPTERMAAQIEYEADTWDRSNAFLQSMWAELGGTPGQLDDLFRMAVTL